MEYVLPVVLFLLAFVLIVKGGDLLVDSAIWLSRVSRIPDLVIGATVVSVATTLPEVLVSTLAVARGTAESADFGISNGTGSVIFNALAILGLAALLRPSDIRKRGFGVKLGILLGATALFGIFALTGHAITRVEGIVLLAVFVAFVVCNALSALRDRNAQPTLPPDDKTPVWLHVAWFFVGAAGIGFGAKLLVDNGMKLAGLLGIGEGLMGLTFVAIGTSLPELVTSLTAARRGKGGIAVGNILGANVFNTTLLPGLCGVIGGTIAVDGATLALTVPVMVLSALALLPTALSGRTHRLQGALMLAVYAVYLALMLCCEFGLLHF